MSEANPAAPEPQQRRKPLLTVPEQIEHLKSRGVAFDLCPEAEASDYLRSGNNLLRASSYRKLFPVQDQGPHAGEYLGLDFEHLRTLSSLDRQLRQCFLLITIDIEHFAHMALLEECERRGEDGYAIVADYLASINHKSRNHITGNLRGRSADGDKHDEYSGDLIAKHLDSMPVWVFVESVEFGTFNDLYLFCAERWEDERMKQEHYVLKSVKAMRNACAHNNCIINGLVRTAGKVDSRTNDLMTASLNRHGMKRTKSRRAKLANPRISQLASTLYASSILCTKTSTRNRRAAMLAQLRESYADSGALFEKNTTITSFFDFLGNSLTSGHPRRHNPSRM